MRIRNLIMVILLSVVMQTTTAAMPLSSNKYTCDFTYSSSSVTIDGNHNYGDEFQPGDVICITGGTKSKILIKDVRPDCSSTNHCNELQSGSTTLRDAAIANPVLIVNTSGKVTVTGGTYRAIEIKNARYFKMLGDGDTTIQYGFKCSGAWNRCVATDYGANNYELAYFEIRDTTAIGLTAYTKTKCSGKEDYDHDGDGSDDPVWPIEDGGANGFLLENITFHDFLSRNHGTEGFYIGHNRTQIASAGQGGDTGFCTAHNTNPRTHNVEVYNLDMDGCGKDCLNVKGVASGACYLHHNIIKNDAGLADSEQQGAISLHMETQCDVYNNIIKGGGNAIYSHDNGGGNYYNNIIYDSGYVYASSNQDGCGISIGGGLTNEYATNLFKVWNNTIVNSNGCGIRFRYNYNSGSHQIYNNIISGNGFGNIDSSGAAFKGASTIRALSEPSDTPSRDRIVPLMTSR